MQTDNEASSVGNSLARASWFVGLLILIGAACFRTIVLPRARELDSALTGRMARRAAMLGFAASLLVIGSALARMFLELNMMRAMPGMQAMSFSEMAMHTRWGFALRLGLVAAILAMIAFAFATRRAHWSWPAAALAATLLGLAPALAGHAAASPKLKSLLIAADYLHVMGGAAWLGTLFAVLTVGVPLSLAVAGDKRWTSIASLVNSFSPLALVSVTVVVASGVLASWVHLNHVSDLWQTAYGQVLGIKLLLVAMTLAIGAHNFRRVQPSLPSEGGSARLRRSAALELGAGFLILVVTGLLTGISP
jgi:putative copper export protein